MNQRLKEIRWVINSFKNWQYLFEKHISHKRWELLEIYIYIYLFFKVRGQNCHRSKTFILLSTSTPYLMSLWLVLPDTDGICPPRYKRWILRTVHTVMCHYVTRWRRRGTSYSLLWVDGLRHFLKYFMNALSTFD
jgi:hypothetical protein